MNSRSRKAAGNDFAEEFCTNTQVGGNVVLGQSLYKILSFLLFTSCLKKDISATTASRIR